MGNYKSFHEQRMRSWAWIIVFVWELTPIGIMVRGVGLPLPFKGKGMGVVLSCPLAGTFHGESDFRFG